MDTAGTYTMLRQFPAALKLYDRALDIKPNDPNVMASKASIYQAQGNLPEAARLLSEMNGQSSEGLFLGPKITQLRLERNYGEAVRLLQARLAQFHFSNELEKSWEQLDLAFMQRLAGDLAGAKLTAEQARNTLEQRSQRSTKQVGLCGSTVSSLCRDGGEGFGSKASGTCNRASAPC